MIRKRFARVLSVLAAAAVLCCASPASAEGIDWTGMSDGEVVLLLAQVNAEITRRGIEKTAVLAKGTYVAGVDLPAGKYVFTCLAKGKEWGNVTVRSDGGEGKQILWEVVSAPEEGEEPETLFITLNEGDQLSSGVAFSLTIMAGVTFR